MNITCELCGKAMVVAGDLAEGQHVRCPFCQGKFSYDPEAAKRREEARGRGSDRRAREARALRSDGWAMLGPDEKFREAIAACRRDAEGDRYYSGAPEGARRFIGVIFYGRHFRDSVPIETIMTALSAVEQELEAEDFRYLIRHETDAAMIEHLEDMLRLKMMAARVSRPTRPCVKPRPRNVERRVDSPVVPPSPEDVKVVSEGNPPPADAADGAEKPQAAPKAEGRRRETRQERRERLEALRRRNRHGIPVGRVVAIETVLVFFLSMLVAAHVAIANVRNKWAADRVRNVMEKRKMVIPKKRGGLIWFRREGRDGRDGCGPGLGSACA